MTYLVVCISDAVVVAPKLPTMRVALFFVFPEGRYTIVLAVFAALTEAVGDEEGWGGGEGPGQLRGLNVYCCYTDSCHRWEQ